MQSKMIPLISLPMHMHTCTPMHVHPYSHAQALNEDDSITSPCTQGDCTEQQQEARRWSDWCLLHSSWQRQNAKLRRATVLCRKKKKLIGKKKREGTEQIEPFHHTLTSFTSAGIAKSFLFPNKWWTRCVPQWHVCFSVSADFLQWLSLWAFEAVQTWAAILPPSSH